MKFYTNATESGSNILLRGYENGRAFLRKIKYEPTLFVNKKDPSSKWKSIDGMDLAPITFDSIRDAKDFIQKYEDVDNFSIYGFSRFVYSFLNEEYRGEIQYDQHHIRLANIDIETASKNGFGTPDTALEEITSITVKKDGKFFVFACGNFKTSRSDIVYFKCKDERELLESFLEEWSRNGYPDVITGWNIDYYDIPYLIKRISNVLGEKDAGRLSPWGFFSARTVKIMGKENTSMSLAGISSLDYMELYKKFTYKQQDSYRLDNIAFIELGERKLDYSEYASLQDLYERDFQKFIEYNIKDVELIDRLEEKMKLIEMVYTLAFYAKVNFSDVFSQVRMWDVIIHNHLWKENIAIPFDVKSSNKDGAYEGAYVKEPQIGAHNNVMSFDLTSLYPHLIMQYNISPDTITNRKVNISLEEFLDKDFDIQEYIADKSLCVAPNGSCFTNSKKGFLPTILEKMYESRNLAKKKMIEAKKHLEAEEDPHAKKKYEKEVSRYKNLQLALKVTLNSAYGAIGNPYFRFFDLRQATAITMGGQLTIRWAEGRINEYMNSICGTQNVDYVIASDTDSLYISFDALVKKYLPKGPVVDFLDSVAEKRILPKFKEIFQELAERMNSYDQKMQMNRENIASRAIWTAKKRYMMNILDSEGVRFETPDLKIMGLEAIKSSTPASCREAIKDAMKIILAGTEEDLHDQVASFKKKFQSLPFEDVAFPRGVQGLRSYGLNSKSLPIHVRGALVYNDLLLNKKLTRRYPLIREGEKIKFCYLREPNYTRQNVIAAPSGLPEELGLNSFIDYEKQFEKAFLQPLRAILNVIGWHEEKINTLEEFFA